MSKKKERTLSREQIRLLIHFQWLQSISAGDATRSINSAYGSGVSNIQSEKCSVVFKKICLV
jgi:hypothetical protein